MPAPASDHQEIPDRPPDSITEQPTSPGQALLYRLSGDTNPLHADPAVAARAGFDRPILQGLCTYGMAARAVLFEYANLQPDRLKKIQARFASPMLPGETLVTEMWEGQKNRVVFRCKSADRDQIVLSHASVEIAARQR